MTISTDIKSWHEIVYLHFRLNGSNKAKEYLDINYLWIQCLLVLFN